MTETIDITPTHDGQIGIATVFAKQLLDDVVQRRKKDDRDILSGLLDIAFTIGFNAPRCTLEEAQGARDDLIKRVLG